MPKHSNVIAVVNSKGGSGKTTIAVCLAAELTHRGRAVVMVDGDPAGGMTAWHDAGGRVSEIAIVTDASEAVGATARSAMPKGGLAIIDSAGFATRSTVAAIEAAGLVLIPCRASRLDAVRAIETAAMVAAIAGKRRRVLAVMSATTPGAAIVPHVRAELERAGLTVAQAEIGQRTAFAVAALNGDAPAWMGSSAKKAASEIAGLADEINA